MGSVAHLELWSRESSSCVQLIKNVFLLGFAVYSYVILIKKNIVTNCYYNKTNKMGNGTWEPLIGNWVCGKYFQCGGGSLWLTWPWPLRWTPSHKGVSVPPSVMDHPSDPCDLTIGANHQDSLRYYNDRQWFGPEVFRWWMAALARSWESWIKCLLTGLVGWVVVHIFIIMKWRYLTLEYIGVS